MRGNIFERLARVSLAIIMVLSVIQIMPVDIDVVETASAGSTWYEGDWSGAGGYDYGNSSFIDATTYPGEVRISYEPELFITDFGNDRVVRTKMDGSSWAAYGTTGAGVGQFNAPASLTYDNKTGFIYIAEWTNNNITRTRIDGSGWMTYGNLGGGVGNFNNPRGIDRDDETGYIYVTDGSNNRLVKTLMNGSYWQTYNNAGDSFSNPIAVHLYNGTGLEELYVAGFTKDRIIKTQMDGTGWTTYGTSGNGVGQFDAPSGIFMDNSTGTEWIYVSDYTNDRIVKTQIDGTGWTTLGTSGSGVGQINGPRGIYYNEVTEFLYFSDINNDRIVKTKMDGTGWETFGTPGSGVGQLDSPYGLDAGNFSYLANANLSSKSFNVGPSSNLINITWNANVPANTGLKFQFKSADTKTNLSLKNFVGPDGSTGTYYTSGGQNIWPGHNGDAFIQYKVYFNTSDVDVTPILYSVDINYNLFPAPPTPTAPPDDSWTNDNTPTFDWDFVDYDPGANQKSYQFQLDNDNGFGSPENDTGVVSSGISAYTTTEPIADGTWYWRVRTQDEDDNWSTFSTPWSINIDTQDPTSAITFPSDGLYYNSVTSVTGTASDGAGSGIFQVRITIQNLTTSEYWDGTKWIVPQAWLLCTGTDSWSYDTNSISWNSANQYKIRSRATDNVTNMETPGAGITFNFDTQNPSTTITTPVDSGFYNSLTTISGTAGDGSGAGVSFVNVSIRRIVDGSYWSGSAWTIGPEIWLTATGTTSWSFGPVGALWNSDNQYTVRSRATDNATNVEVPGAGNTFNYDTANPSSSITSPVDSSYVNSLTSITGTALDTGGASIDYVNISIKRNSDNLYWDGSGWIVSEIWLNTTGTTSWTRDTGLPTWATGVSYTIRSKAIDTATNMEIASAGNTFGYDTDDPSSTITTPTDSTWVNSLDTIMGTSLDTSGAGIANVMISIENDTDSKYWDGSNWVSGETWLATTGTTSWSYDSSGGIWASGKNYIVRSRADDNATNVETPGAGNTFGFDDLAPTSTIVTPGNTDMTNSLTVISGNAVDTGGAGLDYVNISIMDDGTGLYWNGTAWVVAETWLTVTGTTSWTLSTGLPSWVSSKYYTIRSRATDIVPNIETPGSGNNFLFDSEMPTAMITDPINDTILSSLPTISGTASDIGGAGLQNVQLQIVRTSDSANWNGTGWNTTATSWPMATGTSTWSYSGVNWVSDEWYQIRTSVEDNASNNNISTVWTEFYFDDLDPAPLSVFINNGTTYTNTTQVVLNLSALDSGSGINRVTYSNNGTIWDPWEPYTQFKPYTLESLTGDGLKIVNYRVEDWANNNATVSDTIILDTAPPTSLSILINDDDTYTNSSTVSLTLGAFDSLSGVNRMAFSSDGSVWTKWEPFSTSKMLNIPPGDGLRTVYFMVEDMANNSAIASDTITLDTAAPYDLSIEINNGDIYTNSIFISLELNATDDTSGVYQMAVSTNGTDWSEWADFQTSFGPTLLGPDGLYTIYIKVKDRANNSASPVSDTIYLDRQAPDPITITINDGDTYTNLEIVQLDLEATEVGSGLNRMAFSTDNLVWTDWEPWSVTKSTTLPAGDGTKKIYIKVEDFANNTGMALDEIILDTEAPIQLYISINENDQYTNSVDVALDLSAFDNTSGVDQMSFSTDATTWTDWELFNTTKSYTLPSGDGPKAIYFKVSDRANNTAITPDTIILDTISPDPISIVVNDDDDYTGSRTVTLTLSATDTGSGVDQMAFSSNSLNWTTWEPFSETSTFKLPEGDGIQIAYVRVSDRAGNYDSEGDSIILDTEPPHSLSILIEDNDPETDDVNVSLTLLAIDEVSGVVEMAFSTDGTTWTDWETYSNDKDFKLPAGDGEKIVYFKVRDLVGNEAAPVSDNITLKTEGPSDEKDTDGDGYDDDVDEFPNDPNEWADNDNDKIGDNADTDDDNDEFFDEWEEWMGTDPMDASDKPVDTDGDGDPDGEEGNTRPWMDTDDDGDGYSDAEELEKETDPLDENDYPTDKGTDDDADDYTMYLLILIVIIIVVIVLALALRGKGKGKDEEGEPEEGEEAIEEEGVMDVGEGAVAPPVGAPVASEEETYEEEEEFECPTCGAPLTADATVCTECGEEFEDEEE